MKHRDATIRGRRTLRDTVHNAGRADSGTEHSILRGKENLFNCCLIQDLCIEVKIERMNGKVNGDGKAMGGCLRDAPSAYCNVR